MPMLSFPSNGSFLIKESFIGKPNNSSSKMFYLLFKTADYKLNKISVFETFVSVLMSVSDWSEESFFGN